MNPAFDRIIAADDQTRLGLFTATALRFGTTPQNAEKDFWVCWTLDALFNGLPAAPRLLFKGGTSLSKGFGLISRFSEDIDVTVFRDDIGEAASIADMAALAARSARPRLIASRQPALRMSAGRCLGNCANLLPRPLFATASAMAG